MILQARVERLFVLGWFFVPCVVPEKQGKEDQGSNTARQEPQFRVGLGNSECESFFVFIWYLKVPLLREKQRGGVENSGEEKTYHKTPSQKRLWTPPPMIGFPPPVCFRPVVFLRGNRHRPGKSHFLRPPKLVLEGALCVRFPRPQNRTMRFAPPLAAFQNSVFCFGVIFVTVGPCWIKQIKTLTAFELRSHRPATRVSRALRARVSPKVSPKTGVSDRVSIGVSPGPSGPRLWSVQKVSESVSGVSPFWHSGDTLRTLFGHPMERSVWHPRFRGHFRGHSPRHSGPKGPRDLCSWSAGSQTLKLYSKGLWTMVSKAWFEIAGWAGVNRRRPDYSSNLCPPKIWSIWLFWGVFWACFLFFFL